MEHLTAAEEEALAERIVRNQLLIQELQEENDRLKLYWKQDKTAFPAGKSLDLGKYYVKITENKRIDDTLAKAELHPRKYSQIARTVVDPKKARLFLPESELKKITKVFDNKIEIGLK